MVNEIFQRKRKRNLRTWVIQRHLEAIVNVPSLSRMEPPPHKQRFDFNTVTAMVWACLLKTC